MADASSLLLEVEGLRTHFRLPRGIVRAVDGVDFFIRRGEAYGLVGESGSGKTVTALSIMGLIEPPGEVVAEKIRFDGLALLELDEAGWASLRGDRICLIFQDPQVRLNPVFSIGSQLAEVLQIHRGLGRQEAWTQAKDLLSQMEIPDAQQRMRSYPHELSGGQSQRVMIAMALAMQPDLIIADEPTTALDPTIQAQILEILRRLRVAQATSMLLITHDLGVMAGNADRIGVLYAGQLVEEAEVVDIFRDPLHPYTQGLLASLPPPDHRPLRAIPGTVPDPADIPPGCRFAPRCEARRKLSLEVCEHYMPDWIRAPSGRAVRCWLYQGREGHVPPLARQFGV